MKSIVDRLLLSASSSVTTRRKNSAAKLVWKQTADGKWTKTDIITTSQGTLLKDMCGNPLYSPKTKSIESPRNTFVCGICDYAMHFRTQDHFDTRCSICDQQCGNIQLVCDTCEFCVCCNMRRFIFTVEVELESSCYHSYYEPIESMMEQLFNRQVQVAQYNSDDQQHWLQCMWHNIVCNMKRFREELVHASKVATISDSNVNLVIANLGIETTKNLVRLFVIFQSKFDAGGIDWFSSLIQHERESLGVAALSASVRLKGRLEQLKWLMLELGLNALNCDLSDAVETATEFGKLAELKCLLEVGGADPSANDNLAFRLASSNGHLDVVERLLQDERVDPAAHDNGAIQWASESGHVNIVERLLQDERVDPTAENNSSIQCASANDHLNVVERLLQDDRVDPSAYDNYAIQLASKNGHLNVVERLLQDKRVDPSALNNQAIRGASRNGNLIVVKRLLQDERVDPTAHDNDALREASRNGHLNVVEWLLQDDRVDPSADDNDALREASRNGHLNVVERLLQHDRVDPSADDNRAIRDASMNGHVEVVERLLQDGRVDPAANDNYAIRNASAKGHLSVVERLLEDGRVDPSASDNCAIGLASGLGHLKVVERLLQDVRVDPAANDNFAIQFASGHGRLNVVERLLQDDRVDPSAKGCEAIRLANDKEIVECLYARTRIIVCYMTSEEGLMKKLMHLHNESLLLGGLCLSFCNTRTLPQDVIFMILSEWATLVCTKDECDGS